MEQNNEYAWVSQLWNVSFTSPFIYLLDLKLIGGSNNATSKM